MTTSFQITETKKVLERVLKSSEEHSGVREDLLRWLSATEEQLGRRDSMGTKTVREKYGDVPKMKDKFRNLHR